MVRVFIAEDPDPRVLARILRRHRSRVRAVILLMEVEGQSAAALAKNYRLRVVPTARAGDGRLVLGFLAAGLTVDGDPCVGE